MTLTTHLILDQAIAACDRIESGLQTAAARAQRACQEASRELQRMVEAINADRAARGLPPLDVDIKVPGPMGSPAPAGNTRLMITPRSSSPTPLRKKPHLGR
jgi:hypothetical protein